MYQYEKKVFTPVSITAMILQKVKEITEKATDKPCNDVVIGVPGWWTEHQRRAMLDASRIAGLHSLRLFNELTACKNKFVSV
jgi:heat shock protein 4